MGEEKSGEEVKLKAQVDSRARRTAAAHLRSPYTMDEREREGEGEVVRRAGERAALRSRRVRPSVRPLLRNLTCMHCRVVCRLSMSNDRPALTQSARMG